MITSALGWLLLLIPFLLVFCFTDRFRGFLNVLSFTIAGHLLIALTTQLLHIFTFPVILGINITAASAVIFVLFRKTGRDSYKIKFDWFLIAAFIIIIFELWSVHHFYSGQVSMIEDKRTVTRVSYPYPYFSDEWIGVAFTNYSIATNALPAANPLTGNAAHKDFPNIFIAFFSGLAEIFLLLSLPPLTGYPIMALFSGLLICLLSYVLLRRNEVKQFSATLAVLCLPFIINGQNLPGLWYLLPVTGGLIAFLASLASLNSGDRFLSWLSGALALLLYPPLVVFVIPLLAADILSDKNLKNIAKFQLAIAGSLAVSGVAVLIIGLQKFNFGNLSSLINSYLLYPALDQGIPFAFFGLSVIWRKRLFTLLLPIGTGLLLWTFYSRSLYYFIIGYDRLVFVTSILIIGAAAFGWDWISQKIFNKIPDSLKKNVDLEIKTFFLIIFLFFSWSYTQRVDWLKLVLRIPTAAGMTENEPLAPATMFLNGDDLKFFKGLSHRVRFLAPAWKGLAIGSATGLYPLETKSAIVTNRVLSYSYFMQQDCLGKGNLAKEYHLKYIYSSPFTCANFLELGKNLENLHFYRFNP